MTLNHKTLVGYYDSVDPQLDPPAIQGIEAIDWRAVQHAYGIASNVPALLRALVSDETVHRQFALQLLFETIRHQGTNYQSTAQMVPFLYNLLETDGPHDKVGVACLLAVIAEGKHKFTHCEDDPKEAEVWRGILARQGRSLEDEMTVARANTTEIRRQLMQRLELLLPFFAIRIPSFAMPSFLLSVNSPISSSECSLR